MAIGVPTSVNVAQLEQAIFSRSFFDPNLLLVAMNDQTPIAWSHVVIDPYAMTDPCAVTDPSTLTGVSPTATIAAVCTCQGSDVIVAERLIHESIVRVRAMGVSSISAGVVRDNRLGYAGLDPIGHGVGILIQDHVTGEALRETGFEPTCELTAMVAPTSCYRPPVSREALQLRRTASTRSARSIPASPRSAAGLSHIDVERFELVDRDGGVMAESEFWFSDPEAEVLRPSTAILDLGPAHAAGELSSAESYLIAAVMQTLDGRSISAVETVIDSERKTLREQLQRICFEPSGLGARWQLKA